MAEAGLVISHLFAAESPLGRKLAEGEDLWSLRRGEIPAWLPPRRAKRLSFHWDMGPAEAAFRPALRRLARFLAETPLERVSFDLGPAARRHVGLLPVSRPLGPAAIRRLTGAALKELRRHYQGPLAAENYNYYPTGLYGPTTEPDFIRGYLEEFGLALVLDLAHARITARCQGLAEAAYLAALPLEKTAEIHLSRPWLPPAGSPLWPADAHEAPGPEEWGLLKTLFEGGRLPPEASVFIEYYGPLSRLEPAQRSLREFLDYWMTP